LATPLGGDEKTGPGGGRRPAREKNPPGATNYRCPPINRGSGRLGLGRRHAHRCSLVTQAAFSCSVRRNARGARFSRTRRSCDLTKYMKSLT
jgi:hypothetical protein